MLSTRHHVISRSDRLLRFRSFFASATTSGRSSAWEALHDQIAIKWEASFVFAC
jgi:hypothetical protein